MRTTPVSSETSEFVSRFVGDVRSAAPCGSWTYGPYAPGLRNVRRSRPFTIDDRRTDGRECRRRLYPRCSYASWSYRQKSSVVYDHGSRAFGLYAPGLQNARNYLSSGSEDRRTDGRECRRRLYPRCSYASWSYRQKSSVVYDHGSRAFGLYAPCC